MAIALVVAASSVQAAEVRLHEGEFGTVAQPSFSVPLSVAIDEDDGRVYALDAGNESQKVTVDATGGQFKLCFDSVCTADLAWNAPAAGANSVQTLLRGVSTIGNPNVTVSGTPATAGSPGVYTVAFTGGSLAQTDVPELTVQSGTVPLTGNVTIDTIADGQVAAIKRFNLDGTPSPFPALAGNAIDGRRGPGNTPLAECETAPEPASCDEVPENGFIMPSNYADIQIAVDNSGGLTDGNIYVTQASRRLVYIFDQDGHYRGALSATGAAPFGGDNCGVAVGPNGNVYVSQRGSAANKLLHEFDPVGSEPQNADWARSIPIPAQPSNPCNVAAGVAGPTSMAGSLFVAKIAMNPIVKFDSSGTAEYSFGEGQLLAVDPVTGRVIVAGEDTATEYDASGNLAATELASLEAPPGTAIQGIAVHGASESVYLAHSGSQQLQIYGAPVSTPDVSIYAATSVEATTATLSGAVATDGSTITECVFEYGLTSSYGSSVPCSGSILDDGNLHPVEAQIGGLQPGTTYRYRIHATNEAGPSVSGERTFATSARTITGDAVSVGASGATVTGRTSSVGNQLTVCEFQVLSNADFLANGSSFTGDKAPTGVTCSPSPSSIDPDFQYHDVSASVTGLSQHAHYRYRLVTGDTHGSYPGEIKSFTTRGTPLVTESYPLWVDKTTATLQARVNPNGSPTHYHFEWGETTSLGNRVPKESAVFIGSDDTSKTVKLTLGDLAPAGQYYFRVVASNASGETVGRTQQFQTANTDGLTENRGFELVSPSDKGIGQAAQGFVTEGELMAQAAPDGNRMAYGMLYGLPDATMGGVVPYLATRGEGSWSSLQIGPAVFTQDNQSEVANGSSFTQFLSENLDCGFATSTQPLTGDPQEEPVINAGGTNMYRRDSAGGYTLVTNLVPLNLNVTEGPDVPHAEYRVRGASETCDRLVFDTEYQYPGVGDDLVEWVNGELAPVGLVPGGSGPEIATDAKVGGGSISNGNENDWRAVSRTGKRVYFTATSKVGADTGQKAIFLREDGATADDVSQSQTATPNNGTSYYQIASRDGDYVFFTGRYGLATNGSSTGMTSCNGATGVGCDLYRYSVTSGQLVDLSVPEPGTSNPVGANVVGVLDASEDGSHVYFVARGQLIAGRGSSHAENIAEDTFNLYLWTDGGLAYVATTSGVDNDTGGAGGGLLVSGYSTVGQARSWSSRATPDGRHLVFQASANVTGYDSGGVREVYRYSAAAGEVLCVSCRRDEQPSVGGPVGEGLPGNKVTDCTGSSGTRPLRERHASVWRWHPWRVMSDDGRRVFFCHEDVLAKGAVERGGNLYVWHDGQITLLDSQLPGSYFFEASRLLGASANGDSVYLRTKRALVPQDRDQSQDVYVARVGGGFAAPEPPAACDVLAQGSCEGPAAAKPPLPAIGTVSLTGGGNVTSKGVSVRVTRIKPVVGVAARLRVRVRGAGAIRVAGPLLRRGARKVSQAGSYGVRVRLTSRGRRALRKRGRLKVRARIVYRAESGASTSRVVWVTFKRPQTKRANARKGGR